MTPKYNWLLSILIFLGAFALYCLTLPTANVGYGDSDMLITVGSFGGVAHPPGYPLFIALTWIFTHLPLPFSIAARAHLLSALLSSLTLTILFLSVHQFTQKISPAPRSPERSRMGVVGSFLSIFSLAIMYPYWLYSIIAEKYALNLFLASLIIYLCINLLTKIPNKPYPFILLFFIFGLSLTTHLTLWFLLPMVLLTLFYQKPRPMYFFAFTAGIILPLSLLWFLNLRPSPPLSWHFPVSLPGLLRHAAMLDFFQNPPPAPSPPLSRLASIEHYLAYLIQSFGLLPLLFSLLGFCWLFTKPHTHIKKIILAGTVSTFILIPFIVVWPALLSGQATAQRQYLIGYLFLPFLFALGLSIILHRIKNPVTKNILFILIPIALLARLILIYPRINLKTDTPFAHSYQQSFLGLPQNSALFCFSDVSCFALFYEQSVNQIRPDITIIPEAYQLVKHRLPQTPYPQNPFVALDYLSQYLFQKPIYFLDITQQYYDLLGFDYNLFTLYPNHLTSQLSLPSIATASAYLSSNSDFLLTARYPLTDPVRRQRLAGATQRHLVNAMTAAVRGDQTTFITAGITAQKLASQLPPPYLQGVNQVINLYQTGGYPKTINQLEASQALISALHFAILNPQNPAGRKQLSAVFSLLNETALAQIEASRAASLQFTP